MQPVEALTRLVSLGQTMVNDGSEPSIEDAELSKATSVVQQMLNNFLPVARFRVYVSIDGKTPADNYDYTICCTTIKAMHHALAFYNANVRKVQMIVFEMQQGGQGNILGDIFRGETRTKPWRDWFHALPVS